VSAQEVIQQLETFARPDLENVARRALETLCKDEKTVERIMRRALNPDIPEDVWRGMEDAEDGRLTDMETALTTKPPWIE
jgi:septation ring formation regulator EzrA